MIPHEYIKKQAEYACFFHVYTKNAQKKLTRTAHMDYNIIKK